MDAVITVDEEQRVLLFNQAAEKIFQRPRAQVLGQSLEMLLPARLRQVHRAHVGHFGATGATSRRMGEQSVLVGLRADGEEFPVEASISKSGEPGNQVFTAILRDVTQRVRTEQALRHSREELREMASVSQKVREQEKSRVARELHDELGGALTALKMDAAWLHERLPQGVADLEEKLTSMQRLLDQTVAATRRISADLRPMMLDDLGLAPAVDWLVHDFRRRSGIACELAIGSPDLQAHGAHATAIFRILQESLTNVARHAAATQVEITLEIEGQALILTVRDNGRGFSTGESRASGSFGLIGMRERVYLLNGEVSVQSETGKGTVVEVRIPVDQAENGA
ncbi:MAG: histidine kinase [Betaproteobacteria bacterium RIFCSPLOWO2_02_FULL_62_17]|nr:MAG: histidine kinase [Betaproteobacteria bacterium RIFCSPLOWO2_02_FULL_62_17]